MVGASAAILSRSVRRHTSPRKNARTRAHAREGGTQQARRKGGPVGDPWGGRERELGPIQDRSNG